MTIKEKVKRLESETMINFSEVFSSISKEDLSTFEELRGLSTTFFNLSNQIKYFLEYQTKYLEMFKYLTDDLSVEDIKEMEDSGITEEGFVYIAKQINEKDIYKIGLTKDINKRIKAFSTGNAFIEMIASTRSSSYKKLEKYLHSLLKEYKHVNEWFRLDKKTLDGIIKTFNFNMHIGVQDE